MVVFLFCRDDDDKQKDDETENLTNKCNAQTMWVMREGKAKSTDSTKIISVTLEFHKYRRRQSRIYSYSTFRRPVAKRQDAAASQT